MSKILVIDDSETLLTTLKAYLEDGGYQVACATNGEDGLKLAKKQAPDLVLTDLHMPKVSGLEVLRQITALDPHIPVMIITGAGEMQDAIQALRLGAWDFITKPIADLQLLEHTINRALERRKLIADNQALALQNAYALGVLQDDQAAGRQLQMSLLPAEHFAIKNFTIDYRISPSLELSGDFVEYFKITEECYGIYLADVSGHGASSAFITVLLKNLINQYLARYQINKDQIILQPELLMMHLNNELYAANVHKYITINYCVMNINNGEVRYGVGGHYPSPILLHANGAAAFLAGDGFPLGVRQDVKYTAQNIILDRGAKIIMFSDGVMEMLLGDQGLVAKEAALLDLVAKQRGNIPAICAALGINDRATNQTDDVTILTISH